jgi:hypothetical protein
MIEAENERNFKLLQDNRKVEQSFNIDKLYQSILFSMDKEVGTAAAMEYYSLFVKDVTQNIREGMYWPASQ